MCVNYNVLNNLAKPAMHIFAPKQSCLKYYCNLSLNSRDSIRLNISY